MIIGMGLSGWMMWGVWVPVVLWVIGVKRQCDNIFDTDTSYN